MSLKLLSGNTPQIIYCSMPLYPLFQPCSAQAVSVSVALIDHEQLLATPTVAGRAYCPGRASLLPWLQEPHTAPCACTLCILLTAAVVVCLCQQIRHTFTNILLVILRSHLLSIVANLIA